MPGWPTRIAVCAAALMLIGAGAGAEDPQRTTATYDQWQLRCETRAVAGKSVRVCEIAQTVQVSGQVQFSAQVAVGRGGADQPYRMVFQVPTGVWLPAGVQFKASDKAEPSKATYKRCLPNACFADIEAEGIVKAIRDGQATQGNLIFQVQEGQAVTIPIAYKGFVAAFDALAAAEKQ
jgi:invasion protein IalB